MGSPAILQLLLIVNANIHLGGSAFRDQLHNHHRHMSSDPAWKQRQHTVKPSSFPCSPGLTTSISNQDRQHDERSEELESETSSNYPDVGSKRYYTFRDSAYRLSRESAGTSTKENNADSTEDFDSIAPPSKRTSDQRLGWLESMKKFRDGKTVTASVDRGGRMRRDRFVRSVRGETSPASVTKFYTVSQSRAPSPVEQVSKEKDSAEPPQYAAQTGRDYTESVPGGSGEVYRLEIPPLAADGGITGNGLRAVDRPKSPINGDRDVADVYSRGSSDRLVSTSASDGESALNFSTSPSDEDGGYYGKGTTASPHATSSIPDKTDGSRNYTNLLYEVDGYLARNTPSLPDDDSLSHAALQQREEVFAGAFEFDSEKQKTVASSGEDVDTHGTVPVATTSSATTSNVLLLERKDDTTGSSSPNLQRFNKDISLFSLIAESAGSTLQEPHFSAAKATADSRINGIYVGTTSSISEYATNDDTSTNGYQLNAQLSNTESEKATEAISKTPRENLRPGSRANKHLVSFEEYFRKGGMQNDGPAIPVAAATEKQESRAIKEPPSIPMYTKEPLLYNNEHSSTFTTNRENGKLVELVLSATPKKEVTRPLDSWSVTSLPSATEPMSASVPPTETETLPFEETAGKYRTAEEVYTTDMADASVVSAETESYLDFKSIEANLEDASNDTLDSTGGNSSAAKPGAGATGNDSVSGWPVKLSAVVEGELVLGGLMMVHERSDTVTCGPVMPQGGVQALETMLYTLDRINAHPSLLPNVTIGAHILDDCDKDTYGLEMAVDFIKGK